MKLYSIYDSKSESFGPLLEMLNDAVAIRELSQTVNDGNGILSLHPADFHLYYLGEFDRQNGNVSLSDPRKVICCLLDLKTSEAN